MALVTDNAKVSLPYIPGYPIDGNRWSENQSIKLVNWYRLVLVNRWSIDNHTKIVHRLASIGTGPRDRHHACYLSDHPPFLGSPGDEIGKTIPTQTSQRKEYTLLHARSTAIDATQDCHGGSEHTPKSSRKTSKLKWPIAYYYDEKKERLFYLLLHILFLLDTIGTFIEFLVCMYVIFVLSTIRFVITRLGMAAFFIILQQLMLLLLAISLFAKVQLLLPEFFCECTMQPLSVFWSQKVGPWNKLLICQK